MTKNEFRENLIAFSTNPTFYIHNDKYEYNLRNAIGCIMPIVNDTYNIEEIIGAKISNKSLNELKEIKFFDDIINEIENDLIHSKISCVVQNIISIAKADGEVHENEKILIENSFLRLYNFYNVQMDERKFICKTYQEKDDFQLSIYLALLFTYFKDSSEKEFILNLFADLAFADKKIKPIEYINLLNQSMLMQYPIEKFIDLVFSKKLKFYDFKKVKINNYENFNYVSSIYFVLGYISAVTACISIEE